MKSDRRSFLRHVTMITTGTFLHQDILANSHVGTVSLFIDETGEGRDVALVGILRTTNLEKNETKIETLRLQTKYKRTLRYNSTDRYKVQYAKALIDYFFEEPGLSFYAKFITSDVVDKNLRAVSQDIIYESTLKDAITIATKGASSPMLLTSQRGKYFYVDQKPLKGYLEKNLPYKLDLKYEASRYDIAQLADLLTGSTYADTRSISCGTKNELQDYLKRKLKVKSLSEIYNKPGEKKFIIIKAKAK